MQALGVLVQLINQHQWNGCRGVIEDLPAPLVVTGAAVHHRALVQLARININSCS